MGFAPDRPSGYPLLIHLLSLAGRSLLAITTVQHLAGVGVGVLGYALLLRLGAGRLLATAVAGVVVLDGYAIALEQQILAEAFFTLALMGCAYLAIGHDRGTASLCASGLLLAAATTMRTVALFALPVWVAYVLRAHGLRRPALIGVVALCLPLFAYASLHATNTGRFGLTQSEGWFLYGRVAPIADCGGASVPRAARRLCTRTALDRSEGAAFHLWSADGPARRLFGGMTRVRDAQERSNDVLRDFALAIIRDRPLRYAGVVVADLARYFRPGIRSRGNSDLAITLPAHGRLVGRNAEARDRYFPAYAPQVWAPASLLRGYQQLVHTPRWLLGGLTIFSLLALLLALGPRRGAFARRREVFLLTGMGLAMLLGSAATSEFVLRYLIPTVPLVARGGVAAGLDLAAALHRRTAPRLNGLRALHARA